MSQGLAFWFTGLSGAGKSTVAQGVKQHLEARRIKTLVLDGDVVRAKVHRHLGFSAEDIKTNNALISELCVEQRDRYDVLLVPIISLFVQSRAYARNALEPHFFEVYF